MTQKDEPSAEHLRWLIDSRAANQRVSLKLFDLFKKYPNDFDHMGLQFSAQALVAISFSLWRAAFLADRSGKRDAVAEDSEWFLGKMLVDNAITYTQDRAAREWTFNYYVSNARYRLQELGGMWPEILKEELNPPRGEVTAACRWDRLHEAFAKAVECLAAELRLTLP